MLNLNGLCILWLNRFLVHSESSTKLTVVSIGVWSRYRILALGVEHSMRLNLLHHIATLKNWDHDFWLFIGVTNRCIIANRACSEVVLADVDLFVVLESTTDKNFWLFVDTVSIVWYNWLLSQFIRCVSHVLVLNLTLIIPDSSYLLHIVVILHLLHQKVLSSKLCFTRLIVRVFTDIPFLMTFHSLFVLLGDSLLLCGAFLHSVNHLIRHSCPHPVVISLCGWVLLD